MTFLTRVHAGLAIIVLPLAALAHDYSAGDLKIGHPVARSAAATAMTSAGYLTVENTGTQTDRLILVEAPFDRVEIHSVVTDAAGVTSMVRQDDGIEIAPGETLTLSPGGLHVMFMGLDGDALEVGETIPATLTFERAGKIEVVFNVEDIEASGSMNHDAMNGGGMSHDGMDHGDPDGQGADPDSAARD